MIEALIRLEAAKRLEEDMRRYVYDREPERRIKCLEEYRKRALLPPWKPNA
jgi:hypothetical protein